MDIIRYAISRPITIAVGVILTLMFGLIGFSSMPVQLSPTVDRPEITVTTNWAGRSPEEIVDEIAKEQEERLKIISGLDKMKSTSRQGECVIALEFFVGTNIDRALQEVSDALRQVPEYPEDVDEPVISATGGAADNAIAWIILEIDPAYQSKFPDFDVSTLYSAVDDEIKPYLERVEGVAEINVFGGRDREVRVYVDPTRLAQRALNHIDVENALRRENQNISAGTISEGKRDYRVRVIGQFESAESILDTIIAYRKGGPVYVRDVAEVEISYEKKRGFVRSIAGRAIAINAEKRAGSNVMVVMDGIRERLDDIRADVLPNLHPEVGPYLRMRQVYDETDYITSAIKLVTQNLWVGGSIAAFVLLIFLRSFVSTGIVAIAIPISIVGTFLFLLAMGRSLNVISLAGLAFAVGMVVDNAIVVLENIHRHRHMGKTSMQAAYDGGKEVWGAVLASTLTTVAVFIPVLTMTDEAGQLFRDISLAIVASVTFSLIVSITVIPAAASRWMGPVNNDADGPLMRTVHSLFGLAPLFAAIGSGIGKSLEWLMTGWRAWSLRPALIAVMTIASLVAAAAMMPPIDYLPQGNRNLVFGGLIVPPGYSVEHLESVASRIDERFMPYVEADINDPASMAALPPIMSRSGKPYPPTAIENFFVGSFGGGLFVGATSQNDQIVKPIEALATSTMNAIPDSFGFAAQSSLFGRGVGGGNNINIEISGPDLERVTNVARTIFTNLGTSPEYGYRTLRPEPGNFLVKQPELQIKLTKRGTELGLRTEGIGTTIRSMFDGAFVGEYRDGSENVDIRMLPTGGRLDFKEQLVDVPIYTPAGETVPIDSVVTFVPTLAPQEIIRIEELPSITIGVQPKEGVPLEETINDIKQNYVQPLYAQGLIDSTMRVRLEGTAARLDQVRADLVGRKPEADEIPGWTSAVRWIGIATLGLCAIGAVIAIVRAVRIKPAVAIYAALGILIAGGFIAALFTGLASNPQFITARFMWALAVTYLLMCALFESFVYPFVIMFTVPLAIVGGFAGLNIVHNQTVANPLIAVQNLDVLTMLGFVILVGVVVNNAILIVHQSLNLIREDELAGFDANPMKRIAEAVTTRIRPVFMSTTTSVGGMLPLVLFPGSGSELYRGLGSVVIGGLIVSTIFTLILVPLLLSLTYQMRSAVREIFMRKETAMQEFTVAIDPKPAHATDASERVLETSGVS